MRFMQMYRTNLINYLISENIQETTLQFYCPTIENEDMLNEAECKIV